VRAVAALVCFASLLSSALAVTVEEVKRAGSVEELQRILSQGGVTERAIGRSIEGQPLDAAIRDASDALALRDSFRPGTQTSDPAPTESAGDQAQAAKEITSHPAYRVDERPSESNWLGNTLGDFFRRVSEWFQPPEVQGNMPGMNLGFLGVLGEIVKWVVIVALVGAVVYLIIYAIGRRDPKRRAKSTGLLEEGEEAMAADEWLAKADDLIAGGEHRLAMRCLFLGCLMLCDEARVAEFRREETNWEHHDRIMRSRRRPESVSFTDATRRFDLVWYGERGDFAAEARWMREFYMHVKSALRSFAA
jgi:hypothetical protein